MSIVKGTGGYLSVSADLITSADYSVVVWTKLATPADGYLFYNKNVSPDYVRLTFSAATMSHGLNQQFSASVTDSGTLSTGSWLAVIGHAQASRNRPELTTANGDSGEGSFAGTYTASSSPTLNIFSDSSGSLQITDGTKIGAIAIYNRQLNGTERTAILGGADPTDYTGLVEYWNESLGVVSSGSNLTTWTGQIASTVLSPTGTVTVDDADQSPVAAPATLSIDSDPASMQRGQEVSVSVSNASADDLLSGAFTATLGGESLTISSFTNDTGNAYTLGLTVPTDIDLKHDATGYTLTITENSINANSAGSIPLNEETGYDYINQVDPVVSSLTIWSATGGTPVTGYQAVYQTVTIESGYTVVVDNEGYISIDYGVNPITNQSFYAYSIADDNVYQGPAVLITFNANTGVVSSQRATLSFGFKLGF